jgi:hypothetical protein
VTEFFEMQLQLLLLLLSPPSLPQYNVNTGFFKIQQKVLLGLPTLVHVTKNENYFVIRCIW